MNHDALTRLRKRLDNLRIVDDGCAVFGAAAHGHALEPPLDEATIAAQERLAGVSFPEDYRAFVGTVAAAGAGPYYGLRAFPDAEDLERWRLAEAFPGDVPADDESLKNPSLRGGALLLADQGCGYKSMLVLVGEKRGQVWADMREAHEGFVLEAGSFVAWYEQWLDKALAEWAIAALPGKSLDHDRSDALAFALERALAVLERLADPNHDVLGWEKLYPIHPRDVLSALVALHTAAGRLDEARAAIPRLVAATSEPHEGEALAILAKARIARAERRDEEALRLAEEGLALPSTWHSTRTALFVEKEWALGFADRHAERIATILQRAKHSGERFAYFDATWAQLEMGDLAAAAETLMLAGGKEGDIPIRAARALEVGEELFAFVAGSDLQAAGAKLRESLEQLARAS